MPNAPAIRFFKDTRGRRIAYAKHGRGPPLVCAAWWVSHLEEDWADPSYRRFFESLGASFTVYRYDRPGSGLSDREREEIDVRDEADTLEALIDHAGLSRLSMFGLSCAGPPALLFAARHPRRMEKLVLFGSFVRGRDVAPPPMQAAMKQLVEAHWGMGARMITDLFDPKMSGEDRAAFCAVQRRSATKTMAANLLSLTFDTDAAEAAAQVPCPTLVLHRKQDPAIPFAAGRELAATLPNATFEPLEGAAHVPWFGDLEDAVQRVVSFLGGGDAPPAEPQGQVLERRGDIWSVSFGGESALLKATRGLEDLAVLLAHPNQEVHVRTLVSGGTEVITEDTEPMLDDEALAAYRTRLASIDADLENAAGLAAERLKEEKDAIARELRAAVGLGGKKRKLDPATERARKAVTARIRGAIQKIRDVAPALGQHLESFIITGTYCEYRPPEDRGWTVR